MHPKSLLRGAHAYLSPTAALGGLSAAHAASQPMGVPHSIAEIVAHMAFWQEWFLDTCAGKAVPFRLLPKPVNVPFVLTVNLRTSTMFRR